MRRSRRVCRSSCVSKAVASEMHAAWKIAGVDVDPNFYHLESDGVERWQSKMVLPSSPQPRHDWILHLEINARAVDINTSAR